MTQVSSYSTAKPLIGSKPTWIVDAEEQLRVASYDLYDGMFWNVPQTFKLSARGQENNPIYIPAPRIIVETLHRFLAPSVQFIADPAFGTPNDQLLATQVMTDLVRRESLYSRFNSNKRFGIIRGDWMFHLYADPNLPPGSKVTVQTVDPGKVFKITKPDNVDIVIGYHIAEPMTHPDNGKQYIRRTTYMKDTLAAGPSPITVTDGWYELDEWGGPGQDPAKAKLFQPAAPDLKLPAPIDALPIYHIPNFKEPNVPWGASEFKGIERVFAAINQSISDEELALAMEGLGVYASDGGTPIDDDGNEVPWDLGPGRVVEIPEGKKFLRVSGVSQVTPYQDHVEYLHKMINQVTGQSDFARGNVDVTVAESGIALMLELAPLLATALEKEQVVTDVTTQMLFGLAKWFVAYEGGIFNPLVDVTRWIPVYGDKVPQNRAAQVTELLTISQATPQIVPTSYVRTRLRTLGYEDLPDEATIAAEMAKDADAQGARVDATINADLTAGAADGADLTALT